MPFSDLRTLAFAVIAGDSSALLGLHDCLLEHRYEGAYELQEKCLIDNADIHPGFCDLIKACVLLSPSWLYCVSRGIDLSPARYESWTNRAWALIDEWETELKKKGQCVNID